MGLPVELRESWRWLRGGGPSTWLVSLLLHAAAVTALGFTAVQRTPQGAASQPVRNGGIVLVAREAAGDEYFSDPVHVEPSRANSAAGPPLVAELTAPPTIAELRLPRAGGPLAGGIETSDLPPGSSPRNASQGGLPSRGHDAAVETQIFGVRGKGTRFVYVFDRSSSMEGGPLQAAKRELIASLQSLQSVHQFQIIFYNQEPQLMPVRGPSAALIFGDEPGKRLAAQFVGSIHSYGATDHMQALKMALHLRPDVVFFLTDADEPQLGSDDFQKIHQWNQGTSINAIEFGLGPPQSRFSFLARLAAENGGQHTYVDITRLTR